MNRSIARNAPPAISAARRRKNRGAVAFVAHCVAVVGLLCIALCGRATADVIVNGSVSPADNPFTVNVNEGLPFDGNGINFNVPSPPVATDQTNFEGESEIIVGVSAPGDLTINNGSFLRYLDLIIGDSQTIGSGANQRTLIGEGLMRIVGVGAYYNNDPTKLPAGFPPYEDFGSIRPADVGYDLYVGRTGFGVLEITAGARAEIQDAVIIGDTAKANGALVVDGLGSHLVSGGFSDDIGQDELHQMIVGHFGTGSLTISNGGRVLSDVGGQQTVVDFIGAVIGGEAYLGTQAPMPGGEGTVLVTDQFSRWTIMGTLQVGGFHNENGDFGPEMESEGDNLTYATNVGKGTLRVANNALVSLLPIDDESPIQSLYLAIGSRGRVVLDGGRINVGTNIGDDEVAERDDLMRVINDGVIQGSGRIDTGIFRNRYLGQVEVRDGQHLVIGATSSFDDPSQDATPMVNWGVMRVIGTPDVKAELEFDRPLPLAGDPATPFENRLLTTPPLTGRKGGLIHVQDGVVRFRAGLANQGALAFTGGDNLVVGDVLNLPSDGAFFTPGVISVDGIGTHVVFEDNLTNDGILDISAASSAVDVLGDFITTGSLQLELIHGLPFRLNIIDDAILSGLLQVTLVGPSPSAGDAFGLLATTGDLAGIFTAQSLPTLPTDLGWTIDYNYDLDAVTLRVLSLATVSGADFNGDGVVDTADLAILEMNFGITMGASPLQGDADGDGDVDGDDYEIWLMTMSPGSGAGSGIGSGAVPEPASLTLVGMLALAGVACRRRAAA